MLCILHLRGKGRLGEQKIHSGSLQLCRGSLGQDYREVARSLDDLAALIEQGKTRPGCCYHEPDLEEIHGSAESWLPSAEKWKLCWSADEPRRTDFE